MTIGMKLAGADPVSETTVYAGRRQKARFPAHIPKPGMSNDSFSHAISFCISSTGRLVARFRPEQPFRALGGADRSGFYCRDSQIAGCMRAAVRNNREAWTASAAGHGPDQRPVRDREGGAAGVCGGVPPYYFGQIAEARQQPGTVSYSGHMQLDLLQETTDEMARNGCKKVVIVNGHGGNLSLLPYFAQLQMQIPHDYVVYIYWWPGAKGADRPYKGGTVDMHAGESETAHTLVTAPGLVHMDRAQSESGADQARVHLPEGLYTGIWWYARFPNHYSGDGSLATKELGEYDIKAETAAVAEAIRAAKADSESMKLQQQFYEDAKHPLDTKQ